MLKLRKQNTDFYGWIRGMGCVHCILLLIVLCTGISGKKRDREMRWQKAEKLVSKKGYTRDYKDSLRTFYEVGSNKDLRELPDNTLSFAKREKVVYDGGWGFVKAGFGIIEAKIDRKNSEIIVTGKAVTNNFTSAFFKVRDYVRGVVDLKGFYPHFFEQHIHENRYKKSSFALYDHEKGKLYSNRKKKKSEYDVKAFPHNYMSLLYYLRTLDFAPKDTFSISCFVHGKEYPIFFKVLKREEIDVAAGTFKCLKVQPRLVGEGRNFNKRDKMFLWFTDDEHRMLVKGKSRIALGYLSAELIHYERE